VALVVPPSDGGIRRYAATVVAGLSRRNVQVIVVGPTNVKSGVDGNSDRVGYRPVAIGRSLNPLRDLRAIRALRRAMSDVDLVYAQGIRAAAMVALAVGRRKPGRVVLVAHWHNALLSRGVRRWALSALEIIGARRADLLLGASTDLVKRAIEAGAIHAELGAVSTPVTATPVTATPVTATPVTATPVTAELQRPSAATVRSALGVEAGRRVILAVGRLAAQKDYPMLLTAAAYWRELSHPPLVLIAGDGPERQALAARIATERLPVRLLGHRNDIADLLAVADVVVLPSRWEARSLIAQEALAAGVPLVATAVGGIPELVGDAAVLTPVGDAVAFAEAVCDLLADSAISEQLAVRGRIQAASWPTEDDTMTVLRRHFSELTGR
jgi:glycosyltransferase involved in cell wall biosynthesis